MCKHEIQHLMGTADGIVCRKCGAKFASMDEINPEPAAEPEAPAEPAEKPKRTRKSAKKGAD